jgi:hypothetical protein
LTSLLPRRECRHDRLHRHDVLLERVDHIDDASKHGEVLFDEARKDHVVGRVDHAFARTKVVVHRPVVDAGRFAYLRYTNVEFIPRHQALRNGVEDGLHHGNGSALFRHSIILGRAILNTLPIFNIRYSKKRALATKKIQCSSGIDVHVTT